MALSKTRTFFDGPRKCLNFLSHERGAPHLLSFFGPFSDGKNKNPRDIPLSPHPSPLPKGEGTSSATCQALTTSRSAQKQSRPTPLRKETAQLRNAARDFQGSRKTRAE